jgi:hypothetical protein
MSPFSLQFLKPWQPSPQLRLNETGNPQQQESQPTIVSTSSDESFDPQSEVSALGQDLLEDWPRRNCTVESEDASIDSEDTIRHHMSSRKTVTIAEISAVRSYPTAQQEFYTSKDRKAFQIQAVREAVRIRDMMNRCPEGYKGGKATLYLIERNLIASEDMLGIENLMLGTDRARKTFEERRMHTAFVLKKQRELVEKTGLNADKLAEVASLRSSKNVERAKLRAVLAIPSRLDRRC